jgi:hypothetical protein
MKLWSIFSIVFALGAAVFWGWSAMVHIPILRSGFGQLVCEMKDGSIVGNEAPFYAAMARIARLNAVAAGCAFASALSQAIALLRDK